MSADFHKNIYYIGKQKYFLWEVFKASDNELVNEAKIKITLLNKKSLYFQGRDLSQDLTIPLKEFLNLTYDSKNNFYTFLFESNLEFTHKLSPIFF